MSNDTCVVSEGRFVQPCDTLAKHTDNWAAGFSRAKGLARWHYVNMHDHKPSRTFFGCKTKEAPNGMAFNFCPWCGTDISAPFSEEPECSKEAGQ